MELSKALFNTCYQAERSVLPSVGLKSDDPSRTASKETPYKSIVKGRSAGLWTKDHKEKKKQELRTLNARIHAAVSVAGVAAAVASMVASNAMSAEAMAGKLSAAMASASSLVASHCIEIAEDMGAGNSQISAVVSSAINAKTNGDIMALTAGAATALRGAATLTARLEKMHGPITFSPNDPKLEGKDAKVFAAAVNFVARGGELTKRTRKGDLHRKQVSFNVNSNWQVIAKLKSKHMGGAFTKKKKFVVYGICRDIAVWPGSEMERKGHFGIRTSERMIEFECEDGLQKQLWVEGIQNLLNLH